MYFSLKEHLPRGRRSHPIQRSTNLQNDEENQEVTFLELFSTSEGGRKKNRYKHELPRCSQPHHVSLVNPSLDEHFIPPIRKSRRPKVPVLLPNFKFSTKQQTDFKFACRLKSYETYSPSSDYWKSDSFDETQFLRVNEEGESVYNLIVPCYWSEANSNMVVPVTLQNLMINGRPEEMNLRWKKRIISQDSNFKEVYFTYSSKLLNTPYVHYCEPVSLLISAWQTKVRHGAIDRNGDRNYTTLKQLFAWIPRFRLFMMHFNILVMGIRHSVRRTIGKRGSLELLDYEQICEEYQFETLPRTGLTWTHEVFGNTITNEERMEILKGNLMLLHGPPKECRRYIDFGLCFMIADYFLSNKILSFKTLPVIFCAMIDWVMRYWVIGPNRNEDDMKMLILELYRGTWMTAKEYTSTRKFILSNKSKTSGKVVIPAIQTKIYQDLRLAIEKTTKSENPGNFTSQELSNIPGVNNFDTDLELDFEEPASNLTSYGDLLDGDNW